MKKIEKRGLEIYKPKFIQTLLFGRFERNKGFQEKLFYEGEISGLSLNSGYIKK